MIFREFKLMSELVTTEAAAACGPLCGRGGVGKPMQQRRAGCIPVEVLADAHDQHSLRFHLSIQVDPRGGPPRPTAGTLPGCPAAAAAVPGTRQAQHSHVA